MALIFGFERHLITDKGIHSLYWRWSHVVLQSDQCVLNRGAMRLERQWYCRDRVSLRQPSGHGPGHGVAHGGTDKHNLPDAESRRAPQHLEVAFLS